MGGHAEALMAASPASVRLLGLDVDPEALARASTRLARFGERVTLARASFRDVAALAQAHGATPVAGVLLDLGVSSYQIEGSGRGFSFEGDEPLDMRLDPGQALTAEVLLNETSERDLARLLAEHGDERHARRIARAIVQRRPLRTTADLVAAVKRGVPRAAWPRHRHVATRTFQAVRMAVNDEPAALRQALPEAARLLAPGARLAVISFHSGEDRIVKQTFRTLETAGAAARPTGAAARPTGFAALEPSPVVPGDDEVRANPRARSARLRVLEREL
jgi:16S rRNA (cytosine1402-N4)-methyltransferase